MPSYDHRQRKTSFASNSPGHPGNNNNNNNNNNNTYTSPGHPSNQNYNNNSSNNNNNSSNNVIIDPKANEDAGIYEANQNLFDDIKNSYTSPQDTYASDLNFINVDPETIEDLGLFDKIGDEYALSDEVLEFYGVDPNNPDIYEVLDRPRKHRYIYFAANKTDKKILKKCLNYKTHPYPKGDTSNYDSGDKVLTQMILDI
jgi:hypothetical protein